MRRTSAVLAGIATGLLVAFVALPVVAIFVRVPPAALLRAARDPAVLDALAVSLKTTTIALLAILVVGTPAAWVLATRRFRGREALVTLLELPLVLPPAVAGIGLFAAFGRAGLLGGSLRAAGVEIPFTQVAVVLALAFVALPFYVRQAIAAFGAVDPDLIAAGRTLGAGPAGAFLRVAVPVARPGLLAGAALAWARALGEFGATILFAGSLRGHTQTLPLAVFESFTRGDLEAALAASALLVAVSAALLVAFRSLLRSRGRAERLEAS